MDIFHEVEAKTRTRWPKVSFRASTSVFSRTPVCDTIRICLEAPDLEFDRAPRFMGFGSDGLPATVPCESGTERHPESGNPGSDSQAREQVSIPNFQLNLTKKTVSLPVQLVE